MFDKAFCDHLEDAISGVLGKSGELDWRRCSCDGILLPEDATTFSQDEILIKHEVITHAWIDEGRIKDKERGQFLYDMKLYFGDESLKRIQNNERLEDSILMSDPDSWIFLDRENKLIEIQL
jgi:hypothetical protein